ncbi:sn-glycerol-1-phosphate dehydrogenase [Saliterribacillus persicus]|uniref:Glycerol-1-phosphate dehydrogenase [NAD(P)+] n=1 Tax=Saliterribacillus persicus TaxID=930114 RepID=A0A368Y909_9BACI|nr:sn-glycerol-1-phosphate dehydrogenase [Saliterribacillus persicus]RCW76750.1 glycerol-1-phosphate dehydrogenase [NAD(P)+] [Saliterribacillus persicus]
MNFNEEIQLLMKEWEMENIVLPEIFVEKNIMEQIPAYLTKNDFKNVVLAVDDNTWQATGDRLATLLTDGGIEVKVVRLHETEHQQVIADEKTLVQLLIETEQNTDLIIAVGSGTIHDIVRFAGFKMNIPFLSVPTAASVDGFTSKGAPLILKGVKQTIQTASPIAVFADLKVLTEAPPELTAAGFGDILGKYTSLLDWKISDWVAEEPYNERAASLTKQSLEQCMENVDKIARHDEAGVEVLIRALIESGIVMLVLDFSRPASGGEHHLSHYWEMDMLDKNLKQHLHGAKVGVTTTIIIDVYKQFANQWQLNELDPKYKQNIEKHWSKIVEEINNLPSPEILQETLRKLGGPDTPQALRITKELVQESLNNAQHLRDRCTGLLLINLHKKDDIPYPIGELSLK